MRKKRAFLLSVEGIEGAGKSTQCRKLVSFLRRRGLRVVLLREPGSSGLGEEIRRILLHGRGTISALTEVLLFTAARSELVRQKIVPALARYDVVIVDRYLDATVAYQGYGSGVDLGLIQVINQAVTAKAVPDMTLLFDLSPREGLSRCGQNDRFERREIAFHKRVRRGYVALSRTQRRFRVISVDDTAAAVFRRVEKVVDEELCRRNPGFRSRKTGRR